MSRNPLQWVQASREFVSEIQIEFKKVTWPTRKEAIAGTAAVLVVVAVIGVSLFAVDSLLAWLMSLLLP